MSYLVLARKWRPRRFAELVGQEHVVRALTNALDSGRVHHAFLFTGTRGVGKTTIARIFAKSLNCERGTSAEPCGECNSCMDIDAGRFLDLLEIDAASNTGVDDVREVIENAQYMPSRGRMKVYLIDEVHMLSKAAFNALLKTLEEPPGHVKFLLATTDPQKLPVTVLSRCLQFNLKRLDEAQISGQINRILDAEGIAVEPGAVRQLTRAADGSLRDGLSLLDQAIAYTGGELTDAAVASMLGTVDHTRVGALLEALADGDGEALLAEVAALAEFSPDWGSVLEALTAALHRIQVRQLVPGAPVEADGVDVEAVAAKLRPELVQLWYQMALHGRRDLPLAPSPRAGFEMSVLRMLAFRPAGDGGESRPVPAARRAEASPAGTVSAARGEGVAATDMASTAAGSPDASPPPAAVAVPTEAVAAPTISRHRVAEPPVSAAVVPPPEHERREDAAQTASMPDSASGPIVDAEAWLEWLGRCELKGPARVLAEHAGFVGSGGGVLELSLAEDDELLNKPALVNEIAQALAPSFGAPPTIRFERSERSGESLRQRTERVRDERQVAAEQAFMDDPEVQRLIERHGARVVPDSIRPFDA
ncbi:DNA polymerase III subunit gamma/tau [Novilysobacter erysipheiresistens]|uniref:DNA polymerase III subunit gamma/tau n=1 Tax=Novilysobacter erysipheiresistens TaxID=1749332 RepID=A0ABU7YWJ3_9GAMM